MIGRLKAWFGPKLKCDHDYHYMSVELLNNATLTWYWCSKCGEAKAQKGAEDE